MGKFKFETLVLFTGIWLRHQFKVANLKVADLLALLLFFVPGLIGLILFAYYSTQPQSGLDGEIKDANVPTWASAMTLFTGSQIIIRVRNASLNKNTCARKTLFFVTVLMLLLQFITFFGYALSNFEPYATFYMFLNTFGTAIVFILILTIERNETTKDNLLDIEIPDLKKSNEETSPKEKPLQTIRSSLFRRIFLWYNCCNLAIFLAFSILLAIGGCTFGEAIRYNVRGSYLSAGGYNIAYRCSGPKAGDGRPVIVMDSDGSHGMYDLWELQESFTKIGRRSCIFDKPGIGWSSYFRSTQNVQDFSNFYGELVENLNERPPYTLLAWGGGGSHMYKWALTSPQLVSSFVFLNVYRDSVEWRMYQYSNNATTEETELYISRSLVGRTILFSIIRGLAIPWGLMFALMNPQSTREASWFYLTPKTWATQYAYLKSSNNSLTNYGIFGEHPGPLIGKPILQIANNRSRELVCQSFPNEKDCEVQIKNEQFLLEEAIVVANTTRNGTTVVCGNCDLSMVWKLFDYIASTVNKSGSYF
jgi:pimeloyl-ACP methyl ester carboxylesterase